MKIYVTYDVDNHDMIRSVVTLGFYLKKGKTEEELEAEVKKQNERYGWERFRSFEISDDIENVFRFMLGENEYKRLADITYVYDKLKDIYDEVESMRDDTFHMSEYLESTINKVKELVPEEDR